MDLVRKKSMKERTKRIGDLKPGDIVLRRTSSGREYRAKVHEVTSFVSENPVLKGQTLLRVSFSPADPTDPNSGTIATFNGPADFTCRVMSK